MSFFNQCNNCCKESMSQFPEGKDGKPATYCADCGEYTGAPTLEQIKEASQKYRKKREQT